MHKKSLLLSTAAAIVLFGAHFNVHAEETLSVTGEQDPQVVSGKEYKAAGKGKSAVSATSGGKIDGTNLTLTGKEKQEGTGAYASGSGSVIELKGETFIDQVATGLKAEKDAQFMMTGGIINVTDVAVSAANKGVVTLSDVLIASEKQGLVATDGSHITMDGGFIDAGKFDNPFGDINVRGNDTAIAVNAKGKSVVILNDVERIVSESVGLSAEEEATITMTGGIISVAKTAVKSDNKSTINLNNVAIESEDKGLSAGNEAQIIMNGGSIEVAGKTAKAIEAVEKGVVELNNVEVTSENVGLVAEKQKAQITMVGGKVSGKNAVYAKDGGQIALTNVAVTSNQGNSLFAEGENTKVTMNGGSVTAIAGNDPHTQEDGIAFYVKEGGQIDVAAVSATADKIGLDLSNEKSKGNKVNFTNTKLIVKNGTGIYLANFSIDNEEDPQERDQVFTSSEEFDNNITLKNSEIRADVLLQTTDKATATLTADRSTLEGGTRVGETNNVIFNLNNGSQWILKASKKETAGDQLAPIADRSRSEISVLNLNDSSVVFGGPTENHYQTLQVGSGTHDTEAVYNAKGNAKLYLNAEWSDGKEIKAQKADHLLIKGDVSGSTAVYVNAQGNATEAIGFVPWNKRGISLIQVSGKAEENSFKLANGYTTISGSPYKYILNAYGSKSNNDLASADQMLFEKDPVEDDTSDENNRNARVDESVVDNKSNDFWDFRLQNQYLANSKVKALVPQMASYLVMPSALFSTGFTDIENQNALLTDIRTAMPWDMKNGKRNPFFLSSYGSKTTLSSNRTGLEYGYGANIGYAAIQTGVALAALEGQNTSSYFGLLGTYGKLSFTPQNMADVDKTALEKWGITAYSSVQHNGGVYLNALLSYGFLKGNIFNAVIGRTAKLDDANTWSVFATLGKKLVTSVEGLIFEPQVQIAYQQLLLGSIQDADNFKVDMGNPHQWAVRMGGRLTKNVNRVEDGHLFSFYGKLNLISTFGDEGTIRVGDSFHLDPMGSAIEGGIGVNAQLFQNIAFHGDISYQQKLQKAGISGATLSGGLKYRF
ncbi:MULTISPECIES: autotransporter outer membrane beta-barrel domain-containing protein [Bartonella]|uniref:autotransporter outer membrane beta-barrel domain-containing protein n=1 Tax=Bartonella TaxID=773 RepID=UPI001ABC5BB2|nr:autotransporter outer membrane beta-barrel domain-containing protein [Bartonella capreoli]